MSLTSPSYVRDLLARHKIRLKKSLGQHFLVDENILKKIAAAAQLTTEETVVEIGAGIGTLTQALAQRAGRVIAVEIDERLIPLLHEHVSSYPNVVVVHQDFLQFDLRSAEDLSSSSSLGKGNKGLGHKRLSVVGNLPYSVTTPILEKLVEAHEILKTATLLVQQEVAEKLCAAPGSRDASAITIFMQSFAEVQRVFSVSRHVFFPVPEVDSALVRLEFYEHPRFRAPKELFFKVVRAAFNLRRKTLKQALTRSPLLALQPEIALKALDRAQLDPQRRGETLSLEEFDRLARALATLLEPRNCAVYRSR
ncbi:MAG: 16S rRNA (adenine(1518)-N(6)/adenine(1519)-N(6))-dimethyltransferase RsmA [Candidatus Bipolaricaulota bacterium]|nr:16S rRNA (adenine(1518)-N(6)/adenine(1519)-N(6))-dimethyltransferase RsmA [Candidatus Bipolaricaulota bacterium]MDW8031387.1 16S rRNA (adenine(1518)-N(6)/adenine(1519)-N(6))-dimethyltransferase RsmA [Candidatus Bipolaricaulota bacterium]